LLLLGLKFGVQLFERVGDVLEEDQPEDDVLVFRGVHAAAKRVSHLPELKLHIADISPLEFDFLPLATLSPRVPAPV